MSKILLVAASALAVSVSLVSVAAAADLYLPVNDKGVVEFAGDALPWYASAKVGVALPGTINLTISSFGLDGEATFAPGAAGMVAVGKYLTSNIRAEVELFVANNAGDSFEGEIGGSPVTSGTLSGSVTTTALTLMGYYEFSDFGDFVPYLSAGLGVSNVNSDLSYSDTANPLFNGDITGNSTGYAARIGAGFQYAVTDAVDITLDYSALFGSRANLTYAGSTDVAADVMGHVLAVGIKGRF